MLKNNANMGQLLKQWRKMIMPGFQWLFQGLISAFKKRSVPESVKINLKRRMKKIKNLLENIRLAAVG